MPDDLRFRHTDPSEVPLLITPEIELVSILAARFIMSDGFYTVETAVDGAYDLLRAVIKKRDLLLQDRVAAENKRRKGY